MKDHIFRSVAAAVSCYCFIIVAAVIVLGPGALFLLFVLLYSQRVTSHSCETLRKLLHDPKIHHLRASITINSQRDKLPVGLKLAEHCTSIAEVMGSKSVQDWFFFYHSCLYFNGIVAELLQISLYRISEEVMRLGSLGDFIPCIYGLNFIRLTSTAVSTTTKGASSSRTTNCPTHAHVLK